MEKIKLFDYTTNFCGEKKDLRKHPDFIKSYNPFMINKVLSMSPKTCGIAMFMSQCTCVPKEQHFAFLNDVIDRDQIFFNYAKRSDDISTEEIQYFQEYFECSMGRALEYIGLMSDKQRETIFETMKRRDADPKKRKTKKKDK